MCNFLREQRCRVLKSSLNYENICENTNILLSYKLLIRCEYTNVPFCIPAFVYSSIFVIRRDLSVFRSPLRMIPLKDILGFSPNDQQLFKRAFTHKSVSKDNNELLEFLGDAVLELVVSNELFRDFPQYSEGELTLTRAALVNTQALADAAEKSGISEHIDFNRNITDDKAKRVIFADALEAVIGAISLDQSQDAARSFVLKYILPEAREIIEQRSYKDAKTLLQEITQRDQNVTPSYAVLTEAGPDHKKSFEIGVYLGASLFATGRGTSKQEAETKAAEEALRKLHGQNHE